VINQVKPITQHIKQEHQTSNELNLKLLKVKPNTHKGPRPTNQTLNGPRDSNPSYPDQPEPPEPPAPSASPATPARARLSLRCTVASPRLQLVLAVAPSGAPPPWRGCKATVVLVAPPDRASPPDLHTPITVEPPPSRSSPN
jgi:hypothetical protein